MAGSNAGVSGKARGGSGKSRGKSETEKKPSVSKKKPQKPRPSKSDSGKVKKNSSTSIAHRAKISIEDLLKICKPVTVNLIRLPNCTKNERVLPAVSVKKQRKPRKLYWSRGTYHRQSFKLKRLADEKKRKLLESKELQCPDETLQKNKTKTNDSNEKSEKISASAIPSGSSIKKSNTFESRNPENKSSIDEDSIVTHKKNESFPVENSKSNYKKSYENEAAVSAVAKTIDELSSIVDSKSSEKTEAKKVSTEKNENERVASQSTNLSKAQLNQKRSARRLNRLMLGYKKKRKRRSAPDDGESKDLLSMGGEKKYKASAPLLSSAEIAENSVVSISESNIKDNSIIAKPLPRTPLSSDSETLLERQRKKRREQRNQRRREKRKTNKIANLTKNMRILVDRLDDAQDPLVSKWKNNVDREEKNDISDSAVVPFEEEARLTVESGDESSENERETRYRPVTRSRKNNGEKIDEKTEKETQGASILTDNSMQKTINNTLEMVNRENDKDDEEIMGFMATDKRSTRDSRGNSNFAIAPTFSGRLTRSKSRLSLGGTYVHRDYPSLEPSDQETCVESQPIDSSEECRRNSEDLTRSESRDGRRNNAINSPSSSDEEELVRTPASRRKKFRISLDSSSSEENPSVTNIDGRPSKTESTVSDKSVSTKSSNSGSSMETEKFVRVRNVRRKLKRLATNGSSSKASEMCESDEDSNKISRATATTPSSDRDENCDVDTQEKELTEEEQVSNGEEQSNDFTDDNNVSEVDWDSNCEENIVARRKLTALRNAMVVLTRLEDFPNEVESNDAFDSDMELEFRESAERPSTTNVFHEHVDENESRKPTENSADTNSLATKLIASEKEANVDRCKKNVDPREKSRENEEDPLENRERMLEEVGQSVEDDTTEEDVEMTLILEESCKFPSNSPSKSQSRENSPKIVGSEETNDCRDVEKEAEVLVESSVIVRSDEEISIDANVSIDNTQIAEATHSDEDLEAERRSCDENQSNEESTNFQNIPATTVQRSTCNDLPNKAKIVQDRKNDNDCDSELNCTVCHIDFGSLIDLTKHRESCVDKNSQEQICLAAPSTTEKENAGAERRIEENDEEMRNNNNLSAVSVQTATPSTPPQKDKRKKQNSARSLTKKSRVKCLPRVDNLKCSVCSVTFPTRDDLSEHIFKHSAEELQEAYRIAKAKAMADFSMTEGSSVSNTEAKSSAVETVADKMKNVQLTQQTENLTSNLNVKTVRQTIPNAIVALGTSCSTSTTTRNETSGSKVANICSCHNDNFQACPDKNDLQIEMVLLCQYCETLFRRRECFEVHYRTSLQCASDRSRGRWAKLFCANCRVTLNTWSEMRHHLEVHARQNAEGTVRFVCNICRVVFFGFGALFYNHWLSHLRDSMFVASRYTFPKASVQSTSGTVKLPLGARLNETYLYVAEHVCATCKESFSTRHDLDIHEETHKTIEKRRILDTETKNDVAKNDNSLLANETKSSNADDPQWYCDMCAVTFSERVMLNDHGKLRHARRYICVSTSPKIKAFMCTHCYTLRKSVSDVEEHWRMDAQHRQLTRCQEIDVATQTVEFVDKDAVVVTSSVSDDAEQQQLTSNQSVDPLTTITKDATRNKTILNAKDSIDCSLSRTTVETNNRESPISSTANANDSLIEKTSAESRISLLRDKNLSSTNDAERRTESENPQESSDVDVTASLMIDESKKYSRNSEDIEAKTESYEILLMDKTVPGHIKMVFGRLSGNSDKQNDRENCESNIDQVNPSTIKSVIEKPDESKIPAAKETFMDNIECEETRSSLKSKEIKTGGKRNDVSLSKLLKNQPNLPEIIEIVDEVEETAGTERNLGMKTTSDEKTSGKMREIRADSSSNDLNNSISKMVVSSDTKIDNKRYNEKSNTELRRADSKTNAALKKNASKLESGSSGVSGVSKARHAYMVAASNLSFEEARFEALEASKRKLNEDRALATTKKPGFLRVKNLSELQAVKTHLCKSCDASFESLASLQEHSQIHLRSSLLNTTKYPKGMTAALVLPDPSERPNTPVCSNQAATASVASAIANAYRNQTLQVQQQQQQQQYQQQQTQQSLLLPQQSPYIPQRIVGYNCTSSASSSDPWNSSIINVNVNPGAGNATATNEATGAAAAAAMLATWMQLNQNNIPTFSSAENESTPRSLGNQVLTKSIITVRPVATSTSNSNVAQPRENIGRQQALMTGSVAVLDPNRKIGENRMGQVGLHVMPAMVMAPSGQANKQQATPAPQRSSSTNYHLPFTTRLLNGQLTYQPIETNKYLCNICKVYRCATLQEFHTHVSRHYNGAGWQNLSSTGFNNTIAGSTTTTTITTTSVPVASVVTAAGTTGGNNQDLAGRRSFDNNSETVERNTAATRSVVPNWSVKNTFHGPMWVMPKSSSSSSIVQNQQTSGVANFSQQNSSSSTTPQNLTPVRSAQIVYRCMICKTALFKNYIHLRNHVMRAHDIKEIPITSQENIVQQNYQCTHCPNELSLFENEDKLRHHLDTFHSNHCPGCRRPFFNFLSLKTHMENCRAQPPRDNQNSSIDNNR